jgi:hypothetical protein
VPVLTCARNDAGAQQGSRECLEGRVLTSAGYGDTIRWREGERLEGLYEARCNWPEYLLCGTRQLLIFAGYVALAAVQLNPGVSWVETGHGPLVFDDGCHIIERSLAWVGSDCALNAAATLPGHSLEDGTFKSGHITIGDRVTIGAGAFVNFGVTMGGGAVLRTDSFAMKGEHIPPHARWRGNPAAGASDHDGRRPPAAQLATHEPSS